MKIRKTLAQEWADTERGLGPALSPRDRKWFRQMFYLGALALGRNFSTADDVDERHDKILIEELQAAARELQEILGP